MFLCIKRPPVVAAHVFLRENIGRGLRVDGNGVNGVLMGEMREGSAVLSVGIWET